MPIFADTPLRIRLRGSMQQRVVDGLASIVVNADGVVIVPLDAEFHAGAPWRLPFDAIDGVQSPAGDGDRIVILLRGGEELEAGGDPRVGELADAIVARGRVVPELTRALRTLGGRRGGTGQDAFFRPLLDARRMSAAGGTAALDAFDAAELRFAIEGQLARLAELREPDRAAAQRALEACLCDAAEPLLSALAPLKAASARARDAAPAETLRAWREWANSLLRVFERADAAWLGVRAALEAPRGVAPSAGTGEPVASWRRIIG